MADPGRNEPEPGAAEGTGEPEPNGKEAAKFSRWQWLMAALAATVALASSIAVLAGGPRRCSTVETTGSQPAGSASTDPAPPETSAPAPPAGAAIDPTAAPTSQPGAQAVPGTGTTSVSHAPVPTATSTVISTVESCQPEPALPWVAAGATGLLGLVLFGSKVAEVTFGPISFKRFEKELKAVKSEVEGVRLIALAANANAISLSSANNTTNVNLGHDAGVDVAEAMAQVMHRSPNLARLDALTSELAGKPTADLVQAFLLAWQELQFYVARAKGVGVHLEPDVDPADLKLWHSLFRTELATLGAANAQLVDNPWRFDTTTLAQLVAVARLVRASPSTLADERARSEGPGKPPPGSLSPDT